MKKSIYFLLMLFILTVPQALFAEPMESYCSVPPYVTRSIAPNIMILMDNSQDMLNPAFTDSYTPSATVEDRKSVV